MSENNSNLVDKNQDEVRNSNDELQENQQNNKAEEQESAADRMLRKIAEKKRQQAKMAENDDPSDKTEEEKEPLPETDKNSVSEEITEKQNETVDTPEKPVEEAKEKVEEKMPAEEKTEVTDEPEPEKEQTPEPPRNETTSPDDDEESESNLTNKIIDSESVDDDDDDDEGEDENEAPTSKEKKEPRINYAQLSKEELVQTLEKLLEEKPIQDFKDEAEVIKSNFYKKHNAENKAKRQEFIEAGGAPEDYQPADDPLEEQFKELQKTFRDKKTAYIEEIEKEKQHNLKAKYTIIEEIKSLINKKESLNQTFNEFRELQKQWHETGNVPQSEVKNLWETYHHNVEKFYDYVKINKELRDLDLKKNLESKIVLCEKAEELLLEPDIIKAFKTLQKYHQQWRETGPVPREKKDEIWERFKAATTKINKKHQEYFEKLREEQKKNLKAKTLLCDKAEEIAELNITSHKEWDERSKELIELQKLWKLIGYTPRKENNRIYEQFRAACDIFFNKKREFYASLKEEQNNNLQLKTELCIEAEGLKDSTDWRKTAEQIKELQARWKTIGPVPRKHSDSIWKRFRAACNYFFEQKKAHHSSIDKEQKDNLQQKLDLIERIKNHQLSDDDNQNLDDLKTFQKEWTDIGFVPFKQKDEVKKQYRSAINALFGKIKVDDGKRNETKFKNRLNTIKQSNRPDSKIKAERDKILAKISQVENDIALWENNIGFFAKSKNAESMIKEVETKIETAKQRVKELEEQLAMVDKAASDNE